MFEVITVIALYKLLSYLCFEMP